MPVTGKFEGDPITVTESLGKKSRTIKRNTRVTQQIWRGISTTNDAISAREERDLGRTSFAGKKSKAYLKSKYQGKVLVQRTQVAALLRGEKELKWRKGEEDFRDKRRGR